MTRSAKKGLKNFCAEKYFMFVTHFPTGPSYLQQVLTNEACRASGAKVLFSFFFLWKYYCELLLMTPMIVGLFQVLQ